MRELNKSYNLFSQKNIHIYFCTLNLKAFAICHSRKKLSHDLKRHLSAYKFFKQSTKNSIGVTLIKSILYLPLYQYIDLLLTQQFNFLIDEENRKQRKRKYLLSNLLKHIDAGLILLL